MIRKIIIFAAMLLIAGVLFRLKRMKDTIGTPTPRRGTVVDNVTVLSEKPEKAMQARPIVDERLKQRRAQYLKEVRQGVGFYQLETTDEGLLARVKFAPYPVCHVADLNAIFHDYRQTANNSILVSLESLDGSGKRISFYRPSLEHLKYGFEAAFKIPPEMKSGLMGLFICSDSGRTGRCTRKKPMDFDALFNISNTNRALPYQDKVYIFNLVVITDKLLRYVTEVPIPESLLAELKQNPMMKQLGPEKIEHLFHEAQTLTTALRSYPTEVRDGSLVIKMPILDQDRCRR
jgi:hypothetical protein